MPNPDWLTKFLAKNPDAIRHEEIGESRKQIVLTAQPKELQAFLIKHWETKDAFGEFSNMTRTEAAAPQ